MAKLQSNYELVSDKSKNPVVSSEYVKHGTQWLSDAVNAAVTTVSAKADKSYVDAELAKKASKTELAGKADTSTVTALQNTVNSKADASIVAQLQSTVNTKANESTVAAISDRVTTVETDQTALDSRMSAIEAGTTPEGSEVIGIRTAADGKAYPTAGDAVRAQVTDLKSDLNLLGNLPINWTDGKYINGSNTEISNAAYSVSDYIKVSNINKVKIKMYFDGQARCNFLDKNKNVVYTISPSSLPYDEIIDIPSKAYYFRACTLVKNKNDSKILIDVQSLLDNVIVGFKNVVNATSILSNANDALTNVIYTITSNNIVSNLPDGDGNQQGTLITFAHKNDDNTGKVQIIITPYNNMFFRLYWSNWSGWRQILDHRNMDSVLTEYVSGKGGFTGNDLNSVKINSVVNVSANKTQAELANCPYYPFQGVVATFGGSSNSNIALQIAITPHSHILYYRKYWGSWNGWRKLEEQSMTYLNNYCGYESFRKVGCIGDSLASGECVSNETGSNVGHDLYEYSWGQYMARMSGNTYYNFSRGGLTTRTWLTSEYASQVVDGSHNCQAYIIGLGENDALTDSRHVDVGTIDDITHPERDTYYANYAAIINLIKSQVSKAKIFVLTNPKTIAQFEPYNEAVRAIAQAFDNVYLIDLKANRLNDYAGANSIISKSYRGGHYNAFAYGHMAKIMANEINRVMAENITEFSQIEFIDKDFSWN